MILSNCMYENFKFCRPSLILESLSSMSLLLAPFAPHLAEELWSRLKGKGSIHTQTWPIFDITALKEDYYKLVIQINGKVRGFIQVNSQDSSDTLKSKVLQSDISKKWLSDSEPKRVIVVQGKLVNIVI